MLWFTVALAVDPFPPELAVQATAGRRTVEPGHPRFCAPGFEPLLERDATATKLDRLFRLESYSTSPDRFDPWDELVDDGNHAARLICTWPDDAEAQRWFAAWEQQLVNALDLDEAALDGVFGYVLTRDDDAIEAEEKAAFTSCPVKPAGKRADVDARDRALQRLICEHDNRLEKHWNPQVWFADREPELGALERAALVSRFVGKEPMKIGLDRFGESEEALARWLFVREDALSLDRAAVMKAVDALDPAPWIRFNLTVKLAQLAVEIEQTRAGFEQAAASEPAIAQVMAAASEGAEAWRTTMRAHPEPLKRARAIEEAWLARDEGAMEGCRKPLVADLRARASELGASTPEDLRGLVHDDLGYWLLTALRRCEAAVGDPVTAAGLELLYQDAGVRRGPRTAAVHAALLKAAALYKGGDRTVNPSGLLPWQSSRTNKGAIGKAEPEFDWAARFPRGLQGTAEGVLASVKRDGDQLELTFDHERWQQPVLDCVETDRIDHVKADGTFVYRRKCTRNGTEWVERQEEPLRVNALVNEGLRAGQYIRASRFSYEGQALQGGYVRAVWAGPDQKDLLIYAGIGVR